jgi:hypothetical protein
MAIGGAKWISATKGMVYLQNSNNIKLLKNTIDEKSLEQVYCFFQQFVWFENSNRTRYTIALSINTESQGTLRLLERKNW